MDDDPFSGWGLKPVELADRAVIDPYFASLSDPLSDYTFSQLFTWRNSLRILWKQMHGHLCVFANGSGDLTLLLPPIGDTCSDRALAESFQMMDEYNVSHGVPQRTRVEYASEELLTRFDSAKLLAQPMGADYLYDVNRMIDLAGGDLASKRQAKNRFLRLYQHRVEPYRAADHQAACMALLERWRVHQDAQHLEEPDTNSVKRAKEATATALTLQHAEALGLSGLVVYARNGEENDGTSPAGTAGTWELRGFTFGEKLGAQQSSITIEKTDLETKGLAQFIFSEFCRSRWSELPLVNVGDDWGLQTLAWTKMSYRPVKLLKKFLLRQAVATSVAVAPPESPSTRFNIEIPPPRQPVAPLPADEEVQVPDRGETFPISFTRSTTIRTARSTDLDAAVELERSRFRTHCLSKRQLKYLQQRDSAIFLVGEQEGLIVGEGIALVRQHRRARSGRIYSLVVRAEARSRDVAQKLLSGLIDALAARGVCRVYLQVDPADTAAIRLYQQSNFRIIGDLPDYYASGKSATHMMCEIGQQTMAPRIEIDQRS